MQKRIQASSMQNWFFEFLLACDENTLEGGNLAERWTMNRQ
jgi:hypothetical protein